MPTDINDLQMSKNHDVLWCDGNTAQNKGLGSCFTILFLISGLHYTWVINESANAISVLLQTF